MDQSQRWRNFFSNVSHIHIKPSVSEDTIKSLAIAAKGVENREIHSNVYVSPEVQPNRNF